MLPDNILYNTTHDAQGLPIEDGEEEEICWFKFSYLKIPGNFDEPPDPDAFIPEFPLYEDAVGPTCDECQDSIGDPSC